MKVLITGCDGQVGRALRITAPSAIDVLSTNSAELDITQPKVVTEFVHKAKPAVIINAAAYTRVDEAEHNRELAWRVNVDGVSHLSNAAEHVGAKLVQISTDFVFDGNSARPFRPTDTTNPLNIYGCTKLGGEQAAGATALIVRTAWVYDHSGDNFVRTMLGLMASRDEIKVVSDQIGTPTWATSLARALWQLIDADADGIYHFTDSGVASWYDFSVAIQEDALAAGLIDRECPIIPITTEDYPTLARRPYYSVLEKTKTSRILQEAPDHWRVNLRKTLKEITKNG